jgi:transposase
MLSLPPKVRVFLYTQPTDMGKSIDGLCRLVEQVFGAELLSSDLFVFPGGRHDRVKSVAHGRGCSMIWCKSHFTPINSAA